MQETLQLLIETQNIGLLGAELWLALGIMVLLMIGVFIGERSVSQITGLSLAVIVAAGIGLFLTVERGVAMNGSFILDDFAWFMKLLTLLGSALAIIMSVNYMKREGVINFEYPILVLTATLGMMLMISSKISLALPKLWQAMNAHLVLSLVSYS